MKKLTIVKTISVLAVSLLLIRPVNAAIYTDINGAYIDSGDEGSLTGGGISFLWDMPRYFDSEKILFYINSTFAYSSENQDKAEETVRTYVPVSAGFEYRYQIFQIPLYLTGSAGAGWSYFKKEGPSYSGPFIDPSKTHTETSSGLYASFMPGINYVLSQNTAFFIRCGYQKTFYDDNIESPAGIQFTAGVRIPVSGSFRSFD